MSATPYRSVTVGRTTRIYVGATKLATIRSRKEAERVLGELQTLWLMRERETLIPEVAATTSQSCAWQ